MYEAPEILVEPAMGNVLKASDGGSIYLPDEDFND